MNTIDLLNGLQDYVSLLAKIKARELANQNPQGIGDTTYLGSVSLSYDFITLKLDKGKKLPGGARYLLSRNLEFTFKTDLQAVSFVDLYCLQKDRRPELQNFILSNAPNTWTPAKNKNFYNQEITRYVMTADEIAKGGYLCSSGDNYRPGYFSEILLEENNIILRQINRWNSKSIDHRDDYHLRDLEFFIPLKAMEEKPSIHDYQIGRMFINLSDGSSKNNKMCGDRIREKIVAEKEKFERVNEIKKEI
jgi:hypothetical protein